jgi:hypothetical protein
VDRHPKVRDEVYNRLKIRFTHGLDTNLLLDTSTACVRCFGTGRLLHFHASVVWARIWFLEHLVKQAKPIKYLDGFADMFKNR